MFGREADSALRTCLAAIGAKKTSSEIDFEPELISGDCVGRAGVDAVAAAIRTTRRIQRRHSAKAIRERRSDSRKGRRSVALLESRDQESQHPCILTGRARNTRG